MSTEHKKRSPPTDDGSWNAWGQHVLAELARLNAAHEVSVAQLREIAVEIARLKAHASIWAAVMGALTSALVAFGLWVWNSIKGGVK